MTRTKLLILLITITLLSSCAVKMVAEYDEEANKKTLEIARKVDIFYRQLADSDPSDRKFSDAKHHYFNIEIDLRTLILLQKMRPKNEESIQICEHILKNWLEFEKAHKDNDTYKDALIDIDWHTIREQFYALAVAEAAKK